MTSTNNVPRVGVIFRPQFPPERLHDFVVSADALGLDDVWLWEDCFLEGGLTSTVAALAWSTSLRVGLGLMPVPFRNPALAAMEIATVARLFPGRFVAAAGHGVAEWMDQVGAGVSSPMTLMREWVSAVHALLDGQTVTASGRYVNLHHVALDYPPGSVPPLLVGARGPKTLALAGELADGVVLDGGPSPDAVRAAVATMASSGPRDVVVYMPFGAGDEARRRIEAQLDGSRSVYIAVGSAADVADAVRTLGDAGATTVALEPTGDDPDLDVTLRLAADAKRLLLKG